VTNLQIGGNDEGSADREIRAELRGRYSEAARYPSAIINVTNKCNLRCRHCFVFREGNPNEAPASIREEMSPESMLATLAGLRDRHGIRHMLWMGGEPMLKKDLLAEGIRLFEHNTITTNGTVPLVDFGERLLYVVSLDGPPELNDSIRGEGVFAMVMRTLEGIPDDFRSQVQVQCAVTALNQNHLAELVELLQDKPVKWMTFSFYVPRADEVGGNAWATNEERAVAVREVQRLREDFPGFVRNTRRSLELMLPEHAKDVTDHCLAQELILPLYREGDHLGTPVCCYGNDVDCDRCGSWAVFHLAAKRGRGRLTGMLDERHAQD